MAFGKKKQEKNQKVKVQTVAMSQNPLYLDQQESPLRESLTAIGTAVVAVFLFGLIVANFSYYSTGYDSGYDYGGSVASSDTVSSSDGTDTYMPEDTMEDDQYVNEIDGSASVVQGDGTYTGDGTGMVPGSAAADGSAADPTTDPAMNPAVDPAADTAASQYILEGSDVRYISESELAGMSEEQLRYARNEIYARHGRRFDDAGLQSYFDSKDWYNGTIAPENFDETSLSEVEKANLETIVAYETAQGYR